MTTFSPREIVSELDRHIVGQNDAKRAVAIALRNRWRRLQLDETMREEVTDDLLHVAADISDLRELCRLDLEERSAGEASKTA